MFFALKASREKLFASEVLKYAITKNCWNPIVGPINENATIWEDTLHLTLIEGNYFSMADCYWKLSNVKMEW